MGCGRTGAGGEVCWVEGACASWRAPRGRPSGPGDPGRGQHRLPLGSL